MAFDQTTRNRLQSFVSSARNILSQEFTRQLQADYGMDPKQGTVADLSTLTHLDNSQRQTAQLLRDTLEHYLATTPGKSDKERTKQVLERIIREQAFTVLNRLAALRMAEAREFLIESIGKSQSSKGFQLYRQLAGTSHGETGDAYRNYLFSLFDEFSVDLAVLFDRHSIQGRLFPRESALLELLAEINHQEIDALWAEDETIGWIYQYFNSQEERKKMRAESQAPRNSRELAVRNQFFTPRYVVEFLTDNTLGRIWYEMTQGKTALVDSCSYLVRRPTEFFLKLGGQAPDAESTEGEALSQEELLQQPVYIPYRKLKDPRSIRMLDPACGSMHFGLYAFDLFEQIYLEAWQLEQELGPDAFQREASQQALQTSFSSLEEFRTQIPKLIIENNIHGVDIDSRAVQIAGLSLWQRAQRAWQLLEIKPQQRPMIVKSNIVCAEPMPGDKALLQEFTSKLNPPVLGQLLEVIFDKMQLAGEAGTLLKIEEEIQTAIKDARNQWQSQSGRNSVSDMFQTELDAATPQQKLGFDLRGIDDATFWDDAEQLILEALSNYANQAESSADQKRLFAEDAAKGFAFIDLCRNRFDVVLMNPPFGEASEKSEKYINSSYSNINKNILCAFIARSYSIGNYGSLTGVIYDKTAQIKSTYEKFRKEYIFPDSRLDVHIDLGWGVLDANVEVAASVLRSSSSRMRNSLIIDARSELPAVKDVSVRKAIDGLLNYVVEKNSIIINPYVFNEYPNAVLGYDFPGFVRKAFQYLLPISEKAVFFEGHTLKSEVYFRSWWEVNKSEVFDSKSPWKRLYNGGAYQRYNSHLSEVAYLGHNYEYSRYEKSTVLRNINYQGKGAVGFGKRGEFVDAHIVPNGFISTVEGKHVVLKEETNPFLILALLNSRIFQFIINLYCGQHKYPGYVSLFPIPHNLDSDCFKVAENKAENIFYLQNLLSSLNESYPNYSQYEYLSILRKDFDSVVDGLLVKIDTLEIELNDAIYQAYSLSNEDVNIVDEYCQSEPKQKHWWHESKRQQKERIVLLLIGSLVGNFKNQKRIELVNNKFPDVVCKDFDAGKDIILDFSGKLHLKNGVYSMDDVFSKSLLKSCFEELTSIFIDQKFDSYEELEVLVSQESGSFRIYFEDTKYFFNFLLSIYSVGSRQAPLYWPLQTISGSYTLWLYYHELNEQTLYTCINDFVDPEIDSFSKDVNTLLNNSARSNQEEKELTRLTDLAAELKDFRDELLRLAKFWKPNLNDGVQITAAPLWKLFQHKAWQKKLKDTWENLEDGGYDWAHLACSIWPERVLRKCHQDRSLAIAHDVEDIFWHEVEVPVKRGAKLTGEIKTEWQPKSLTANELTELINQTITDLK